MVYNTGEKPWYCDADSRGYGEMESNSAILPVIKASCLTDVYPDGWCMDKATPMVSQYVGAWVNR